MTIVSIIEWKWENGHTILSLVFAWVSVDDDWGKDIFQNFARNQLIDFLHNSRCYKVKLKSTAVSNKYMPTF